MPRSCGCCSRSVLKRRSARSRNASASLARNNVSLNWCLSRRGSRQPERGDSMTQSILTIVLSPVSLSGGGIPPSRPRALEEELEALLRQRPAALSAEERQRPLQMGADLEAAWHHPAANAVTRERIVRVVLREVVARVEGSSCSCIGRAAITPASR